MEAAAHASHTFQICIFNPAIHSAVCRMRCLVVVEAVPAQSLRKTFLCCAFATPSALWVHGLFPGLYFFTYYVASLKERKKNYFRGKLKIVFLTLQMSLRFFLIF
jgi:hypothetical protein